MYMYIRGLYIYSTMYCIVIWTSANDCEAKRLSDVEKGRQGAALKCNTRKRRSLLSFKRQFIHYCGRIRLACSDLSMPGLSLGIESVSSCPSLGGSGDWSALISGINVTNMKFSVIVGTFNCVLRIHSTVPRVAKTYKGYKGEVRGFYGLRGSELCEAILSRLTNCAAD